MVNKGLTHKPTEVATKPFTFKILCPQNPGALKRTRAEKPLTKFRMKSKSPHQPLNGIVQKRPLKGLPTNQLERACGNEEYNK